MRLERVKESERTAAGKTFMQNSFVHLAAWLMFLMRITSLPRPNLRGSNETRSLRGALCTDLTSLCRVAYMLIMKH